MARRKDKDPSPVRTAFAHGALSLTLFGGVASAAAGVVHVAGDPADAGPTTIVALFKPAAADPELKARFSPREAILASAQITEGEPSLGVPDPDEADAPPALYAAVPAEQGSAEVRINGQAVRAGESLNDVIAAVALPKAPIAGLYQSARHGRLPKIHEDGRRPSEAYARPFENTDDMPTVSIVLGGLGINYTRTIAAIDELPPEVTLSFVPYARGLQRLIDRAREKGHEVLIEVPMEPFETGRERPYPHRLNVGGAAGSNAGKLEWVLSQATGYYGVTNYQGGKFGGSLDDTKHMMSLLNARGLAFVEDGSLPRASFADAAKAESGTFAKADVVVDVRTEADSIQSQLMVLEDVARKRGGALGSGFAYPLTIDMLKDWSEGLEAKGIVLAPASSRSSAAGVDKAPFHTGAIDAGPEAG